MRSSPTSLTKAMRVGENSFTTTSHSNLSLLLSPSVSSKSKLYRFSILIVNFEIHDVTNERESLLANS